MEGCSPGGINPVRRRKSRSASLWGKPADAPGSAAARVHEAIVQAVGAALPELDLARDDAVAPPMGRTGRLLAMLAPGRLHGFLQRVPGGHHLALGRCPGG